MGRKGVTKRKPSQTKEKPAAGASSNSVVGALQMPERQPAKSASKPTGDWKQAPKKG